MQGTDQPTRSGAEATLELPSGTVTFLFTDIEGSTRLLAQLGKTPTPASCSTTGGSSDPPSTRWHGSRSDTQGDSFFAVFANTLRCASAADSTSQRALATHLWPDGARDPRPDGDPHRRRRGARRRTTSGPPSTGRPGSWRPAHGGQILLSEATPTLVAAAAARRRHAARPRRASAQGPRPAGAPLPARPSRACRPSSRRWRRSTSGRTTCPTPGLGVRRPRGGARGRSASASTTRRPAAHADRPGRHRQDPACAPGGRRPDRPVHRRRLLRRPRRRHRRRRRARPPIARAIGLAETRERPLLDELQRAPARAAGPAGPRQLRAGHDGGAGARGAPRGVPEPASCSSPAARRSASAASTSSPCRRCRCRPRPLADDSAEQLSQFEAIQLFVERARAVRSDFRLTDDNAAAVAEICRRLDGLPLAIELATARLNALLAGGASGSARRAAWALGSGARDLPARQQTLRATIDWSYQLLGRRRAAALRAAVGVRRAATSRRSSRSPRSRADGRSPGWIALEA